MTDNGNLLTRRSFLRAATAGTAAVAAGTLIAAGERSAQASPGRRRVLTTNYQSNWAWCSLCYQVFYAGTGFRGQGGCPKQPGDGHANPQGVSYNYSMAYNAGSGFQSGWRWCKYCQSLFWPPVNFGGACVRNGNGGSHDQGASYNYAVPVGLSGKAYQGGWNACDACGVYYHGPGWGTDAGWCWVNDNTVGSGTSAHTHFNPVLHYELLH